MKTAPLFSRQAQKKSRSSALLITLLMLSLITIIAVAFLSTMTWEMSSAKRNYENQKARSLALLGMNTAVAQLRSALGPWDNPYANFATNPPTFFWSVSPGILSRWSYTSTTPATNYPLFSIDPTGANNLVNLNAATSDGSTPIIGGANPPNLSVYWTPVLKYPGTAAGANNPIIGRYAFWVDDENAKININTADGTMKYQTNSLGLGTPSEVSLQALQQGGASLATNVATNIVYLARTTGLNSPKEILRAAGTTPDLYTNNVFNLTATSRSPDLNIFGQPKMALMPILGDSDGYATTMTLNGITLQPAREIYPTPSQLPQYSLISPIDPNQWWTWNPSPPHTTPYQVPMPLAFRAELGFGSTGRYTWLTPGNCNNLYGKPNYPWNNGMMLAQYLGGTNSAGQPITWPPFPGVSDTGFAGKYTPRQIDSIVAQIVSLGSKEISPDYFYSSQLTGQDYTGGWRGMRTITSPFLFKGWLSQEWVSGMGRTPKVDAMEIEFDTYGSFRNYGQAGYSPPRTAVNISQEWWLPAAYLGGHNLIKMGIYGGEMWVGSWVHQQVLNACDLSQWLTPWYQPDPKPEQPPAPLPKATAANSTTGASGLASYWGNNMLANDQGMDFNGNPVAFTTNALVGTNIYTNPFPDADQGLAAQYHDPYAREGTNTVPPYVYEGTGAPMGSLTNNWFSGPFQVSPLQSGQGIQPAPEDWPQGEMRCIRSLFSDLAPSDMQITADSSTLTISGGISEQGENSNGRCISEPDVVPLEALRGSGLTNSEFDLCDDEEWTDPSNSPTNSSTPPGQTIRDRHLQSVIPVNFTMGIPGHTTDGSVSGITKYFMATVADPLVNKFPGDWIVTASDTAPAVPDYWSYDNSATPWQSPTNSEYTSSSVPSFHSKLADPDSYWMPQADCAVSYLNDIASQTLIPRSARMPNIGYLQYLRTGIIPDDELSLPYQWPAGTQEGSSPLDQTKIQHGTPFRLLSYAPSTETINQETSRNSLAAGTSQPYPDWALLDLLYVPSILAPYGGPYGYYDTSTPANWLGYGNHSVLANYSTGGGSTPGRINPNGMVIYTTNTTIPQPGVSRTIPMQAMLYGLKVNQDLIPTTDPYNNPNPGFTNGTPVPYLDSDPNSIPKAIYSYLTNSGPLSIPGELCNVPAIANLRPNGPSPKPINPTRNDLIRQIVGNLTTQSNTFSVWVAGESVSKSKANTLGLSAIDALWGQYQAGDQITASVRYHFIVERYLDPGADGVYGNSANSGTDGVVGTYDDPVDPVNHPFEPRYLYRVVTAEEIR